MHLLQRNYPELKLRYFDVSVPNLVKEYVPVPNIWPFEEKVPILKLTKLQQLIITHNTVFLHKLAASLTEKFVYLC